MPEGIFPKSDGNILFGTEVNRFASAGRYVEIGSTGAATSGTAAQEIGSIVINVGSLSNPAHIMMDFKINKNAQDLLSIRISGISANQQIVCGSRTPANVGRYSAVVGSIFPGLHEMTLWQDGNNRSILGGQNMMWATGLVNQLDTNDTVVLKIGGTYSTAAILSYSIQSFRSTLSGT